MTETELQRLIIRLVGDGSEYQKMLQQSVRDTQKANADITKIDKDANEVKKAREQEQKVAMERGRDITRSVENSKEALARQEKELSGLLEKGAISQETFNRGMERAKRLAGEEAQSLGQLAGHLTHVIEAYAGFETLKGFFDTAATREVEATKLNAVLEANSRSVRELTEDYKEFAKEQAEASLTTAFETKNLLRLSESFGLTGKEAKKAVSDAIAIAGVNDENAQSFLRVTQAMAKGDVESAMMFSRMILQLRGVKDEFEFREKYQRLINEGVATNAALTKTAEGELHHLSAAWQGLKGDMGAWMSEAAKPAIEALTFIIKLFREMPGWIKIVLDVTIALIAAYAAFTTASFLLGAQLKIVKEAVIAFAANPYTVIIVALGTMLVLYRQIANEIAKMKRDKAGLDTAIEAGREFNKQQLAVMERGSKGAIERIDLGATRGEKQVLGGKEIEEASKNLKGYERGVEEAGRRLSEVSTIWNKMFGQNDIAAANIELEEAKDRLNKAKEGMQALRDKMREVSDETGRKELEKAIVDTITKLREETETVGMDADAKERYKLVTMGATDAQLANIDALQKTKKALEEQAEIAKDVEALNKKLEIEIETIDMTADAAEMYKLKLKGATDAQLEHAKALASTKEAQQAANKLYEEGVALTEKYKDPAEKLADQQAHLKELWDAGGLSAEAYSKALADLTSKTRDLSNAQKDAVSAHSAEALARFTNFQQTIQAQIRGGDGAALVGTVGHSQGEGEPREREKARLDQEKIALLKDIKEAMDTNNRKEPVVVQGVEL